MAEITPEQCPEPFWHKTHRYCPRCTWTEPTTMAETNPSRHRFVFLRQETPRLAGWDDRVTRRAVEDVYFCEDCLEYRRVRLREEVPDPRSFGWIEAPGGW